MKKAFLRANHQNCIQHNERIIPKPIVLSNPTAGKELDLIGSHKCTEKTTYSSYWRSTDAGNKFKGDFAGNSRTCSAQQYSSTRLKKTRQCDQLFTNRRLKRPGFGGSGPSFEGWFKWWWSSSQSAAEDLLATRDDGAEVSPVGGGELWRCCCCC